jgi:hypothetical protein
MSSLRERIERRLREEVCPQCRQEHPLNGCGRATDDGCALMDRLDAVIEVISGLRDYSLAPYQDRIRAAICGDCRQDETGACSRRESRECALDAYFARIVAVIEKELAADPGLA